MTTTLITERQTKWVDNESGDAATSPSLYDMSQFYEDGLFFASRIGGNTFTVPAGLPVGYRTRVAVDPTATSPTQVVFNAAYTTIFGPGGALASPLTVLGGGAIEIQVIAADTILVMPYAGGLASGAAITVATRTALSTISTSARTDGLEALVLSDNSHWRFNAASALAADYTGDVAGAAVTSANLVIVPAVGGGRWIRSDASFTGRWAFQNATPDNTALCTVPAGMCLRVLGMPYLDFVNVTTGDGNRRVGASGSFGAFSGGAADFIGSTAPVTGPQPSTVGADFAAADVANTSLGIYQTALIRAAETITYDLIAAGVGASADGMICVPVALNVAAGVLPT